MSAWDESESWYSGCVGDAGHYYHQALVFPGMKRLLDLKGSLLDLGCGEGVLARQLPASIEYFGVDASQKLLNSAKKKNPKARFIHADASLPLPIEKKDFDIVCFILSLQNIENQQGAIQNAAQHLKVGGKLFIVLNHPCFRIPRQSHWGTDPATQIIYRRLNRYMSPEKIPIQTHPGKKGDAITTYSYHFPISSYVQWCSESHLVVAKMEEWVSDKKSQGSKARMEDRARKEFPLFLALVIEKKPTKI
jgi:SAM-dependent methyltransferase